MSDKTRPATGPGSSGAAADADSGSGTNSGSKLKQGITGPLLFLFILGDVLGAGIYALMGSLSADVGGALWARSPSRSCSLS